MRQITKNTSPNVSVVALFPVSHPYLGVGPWPTYTAGQDTDTFDALGTMLETFIERAALSAIAIAKTGTVIATETPEWREFVNDSLR